jgi:hypothetical protein
MFRPKCSNMVGQVGLQSFRRDQLDSAMLLLAFGAASICLGWVKALQEMQFYEALKAEDYAKKKLSNSDQAS